MMTREVLLLLPLRGGGAFPARRGPNHTAHPYLEPPEPTAEPAARFHTAPS